MENLLPIIIQLISGAVGGNVAGALMKNLSLGTLGNSIAGILGGGLGGQMLGRGYGYRRCCQDSYERGMVKRGCHSYGNRDKARDCYARIVALAASI